MRTEKDSLGDINLPDDALYGIHAARAKVNFPITTPFQEEWYRAMALVKEACYLTIIDYTNALSRKYPGLKMPLRIPDIKILETLQQTASDMATGLYFGHFIVPGISGGAGTSINMNVNEIIANVSLLKSGHNPGEYQYFDPIEDANIFQSTNDVVPTALTVAAMKLFLELEETINLLRREIEIIEGKTREHLRIGYTQMQEAVPLSTGRQFSAYNDALSRDWWRVSKCIERIKEINLGGGAVGTGLAVPRYFIMHVVQKLRQLTGLPLSRATNLMDATSNLDSWVEVHATLKAHAVNLEKMVSDLRLLASDIHGVKSISIPPKQTGSSIMPGKINPVIPEYVISCCHRVYANDLLISNLSAQGCLELNAYLPVIGHAILESLKLLISADVSIRENLIKGLQFDSNAAKHRLLSSGSIATVLVPHIGYHNAATLARLMKDQNLDIIHANQRLKLIDEERLMLLISNDNLLKEGFTIEDIAYPEAD